MMKTEITNLWIPSWATSPNMSRQLREALKESMSTYGQVLPVIVYENIRLHKHLYEVIDGKKRVKVLKDMNQKYVYVTNLGQISISKAQEIHLALNLNIGKRNKVFVASALSSIVNAMKTEKDKVYKEIFLEKLLALRGGFAKTIARLNKTPIKSNPSASPGWIDFKFTVDPGAARVCDDALTHVEQQTGCKRGTAFEHICADFMQSINVHKGSYGP